MDGIPAAVFREIARIKLREAVLLALVDLDENGVLTIVEQAFDEFKERESMGYYDPI